MHPWGSAQPKRLKTIALGYKGIKANASLRIRSETILRMRCELWGFVEASPRILEQIHISARNFENGICSKLANIEKESTAFEAFRSQEEEKEEKYWVRKAYKDRLQFVQKVLQMAE